MTKNHGHNDKDYWTGPKSWFKLPWFYKLSIVTDQLSMLVTCNVPLAKGLERSANDAPTKAIADLMRVLGEDIEQGLPLHEALRRRPAFFPPFYVDMVEAGEESATLEECFNELNDDLFRTIRFRERLQNTLAYVGLLFGYELFLMTGLLYIVIPQFAEIFEQFSGGKTSLPKAAEIAFLHDTHLLPLLLMLLIITGPLYLVARHRRPRAPIVLRANHILLALPFLRGVVIKRSLAHAASILGRMLAAGIPLDRGLATTTRLDISPVHAAAFARIQQAVLTGVDFKDALEREGRSLPASFIAMAALGERSGLLPAALAQITELYRAHALKNARILLDITVPLVVCGIGLMVYYFYSYVFGFLIALPGVIELQQ
jgi:type II secretory pathway component PulF